MGHQNIFLPIETSRRELDYKIILAAKVFNKSQNIFIGENAAIDHVVKFSKGGVFVGKSFITPYVLNDLSRLQILHNNDVSIVYLDEEGAIYTSDEEHWKNILLNKFNASILNSNDTLLTWGDFQKNVYNSTEHDCEIISSGTPRMTLLSKYSKILSKPKNAPEKYILVNTNFGFAINNQGNTYYVNSKVKTHQDNQKDMDYKFGIWSHKNITMTHYVYMLYTLTKKFPNQYIVLRPHPSENVSFYIKMFAKYPNIIIDSTETAAHWIKYADVLINDGSTSALEAYFLGTPVINYIPNKNKEYLIKLPNMIGENIHNIDDLLATLNLFYSGSLKLKSLQDKKYLSNMILNFEDDIDSFDIISKVVLSKLQEDNHSFDGNYVLHKTYFDMKRLNKDIARKVLFPKRHEIKEKMKTKFSKFERDEVTSKIKNAFKLFNKSYNKIDFYGNDLLRIT